MAGYAGDSQPGNPDGGWSTGSGGDVFGALINLTGGLIQGSADRRAARKNTDKTIAAQKAEAELAYQRSIEEWNRQNEYNDPESQMARFKAAGLNPHLIYGQGNAGNNSSPASYQPANLQYKYAAGNTGESIQATLPTLMQIGSWLQGMRSGEADILRTKTETEKADQMIDFLTAQNPQLLEKTRTQNELYPYQTQILGMKGEQARANLWQFSNEYRLKYGDEAWRRSGIAGGAAPITGERSLKYAHDLAKKNLSELDYDVKSSWSEFDITNPQAIMQMVLSGVLGMAGSQLKMPSHKKPLGIPSRERPRGLVKRRMSSSHPDRKRP